MAAEKGYVRGQCKLGFMYGVGEGVPQDWEQSLHWSLLAANQGYAAAQFFLGLIYGEGHGVPLGQVISLVSTGSQSRI